MITITAATTISGNLDSKKCPLLAMIIPHHNMHFNGIANIAVPLCDQNKNGVYCNRW
jgi:hypothetical protein